MNTKLNNETFYLFKNQRQVYLNEKAPSSNEKDKKGPQPTKEEAARNTTRYRAKETLKKLSPQDPNYDEIAKLLKESSESEWSGKKNKEERNKAAIALADAIIKGGGAFSKSEVDVIQKSGIKVEEKESGPKKDESIKAENEETDNELRKVDQEALQKEYDVLADERDNLTIELNSLNDQESQLNQAVNDAYTAFAAVNNKATDNAFNKNPEDRTEEDSKLIETYKNTKKAITVAEEAHKQVMEEREGVTQKLTEVNKKIAPLEEKIKKIQELEKKDAEAGNQNPQAEAKSAELFVPYADIEQNDQGNSPEP